MKALLIVAHGSRRTASNDSLRELAQRIKDEQSKAPQTPDKLGYDLVDYAFLEIADPSIPDGIHKLISKGAQSVVVLPYFLAPGRHVVTDVPTEVEKAKALHPQTDIQLTRHLGSAAHMPNWLLDIAKSHL